MSIDTPIGGHAPRAARLRPGNAAAPGALPVGTTDPTEPAGDVRSALAASRMLTDRLSAACITLAQAASIAAVSGRTDVADEVGPLIDRIERTTAALQTSSAAATGPMVPCSCVACRPRA